MRLREVTYLPSWPANGELLTGNIMLTVGSSTVTRGSGRGFSRVGDGVADVDVVEARERDDVARPGLVDLDALQPLERVEVGDRARVDQRAVAAVTSATSCRARTVPFTMRPIASRPTKSE